MARASQTLSTVPRQTPDYTDRSYWQGTIKMSLSKFFVLRVLHEGPMHGYGIVKAVERTTNGCCSPKEGTVYPVLNEFEAGGYLEAHVETVGGRARKIYTLTEKGRVAFGTAMEAWLEVTDYIVASQRLAAQPEPAPGDGRTGDRP